MEKDYDIAAIGELLIDFTPIKSSPGKAAYERNPGGAPANVLVAASKLGKKTALISKVGDDCFGHFLKDTLERENVCTRGLVVSAEQATTLAFVTLDNAGDRTFDFVRKNSADVMLNADELDEELLRSCKILHFGSVSLTVEPARGTTFEAVKQAKKSGAIISYDPNYRPLLWRSSTEAIELMRQGLKYADIVKVASDELVLLTGESDYLSGAKQLLEGGARFAFVTLGDQGCFYASATGESGFVPAYVVDTVDTTGAGDTFIGVVLSRLVDCDFCPDASELRNIVAFANAAGAINTTKRGAISAMPSYEEICELCGNM